MILHQSPAFLLSQSKQSAKRIFWLGLSLLALSFMALAGAGPALVQAACSGGYGVNLVQASGSPVALGNNANPFAIATGDFNRDTNLDLAVAYTGLDKVSILLGNGSGGFTVAPNSPFSAGASPYSIAVGDFNGDNMLDLVVVNNVTTGTVSLFLGDGAGGFIASPDGPFLVRRNPYAVATGDFNKDQRPDIVVTNGNDNNVTVFVNNG